MDVKLLFGSFFVDRVCERTAHGLWEEPYNAVSSLFFLVTAWAVYRYRRKAPELKRHKFIGDVFFLNFVIVLIGIGSFTFHTFSTKWAEIMDKIPIVIFILGYFFSFLIRTMRLDWFEMAIAFLAFGGMTYTLVDQFPGAFNDSIAYLSSMTALIVIAIYLNMNNRPSARHFLLAALVGCISLFFRAVDNGVCAVFPFGTHFLWHTLNSVLIYILMVQLVRNVNRRGRLIREAKLAKKGRI